jgi:hypothetical protein
VYADRPGEKQHYDPAERVPLDEVVPRNGTELQRLHREALTRFKRWSRGGWAVRLTMRPG